MYLLMHLSMLRPPPPCTGIGGDLTHRMCQIPHPSITIQCQIPTLYIHTHICAGTRANACAGQKPHRWGVISWRIPYQAPPLSPTGGGGWGVTLIGALQQHPLTTPIHGNHTHRFHPLATPTSC